MESIDINKKYIFGIVTFLVLSIFVMFTRPSIDTIEIKEVKAGHAENLGNPILLGTSVPLSSSYVSVALTGTLAPVGGPADAYEFMDGDTKSNYTWWLPLSFMHTDYEANLKFLFHEATTTPTGSKCEGFIVIKEVNPGVNNMLDMSLSYHTNRILVEGDVVDCIIVPVSPETNFKDLKVLLKGI